jgi:Phosphoenolpyruvate carboxykinase
VPPQSRYKIRVVSARSYHCLFMHNMLIRPTEAELATFGRPDFTILNAGAFPCNRYTSYMTSSSSVDVNLKVSLQGSECCPPAQPLHVPHDVLRLCQPEGGLSGFRVSRCAEFHAVC